MQQEMEYAARQLTMFGDAFAYVKWNPNKGDFGDIETEIVHPSFIRVNPEARSMNDAQFVFITRPIALHELRREYGKKAKDIRPMGEDVWKEKFGHMDFEAESASVEEFWGFVEVRECEYELRHVIKVKDTILVDERNPYFDHEGSKTKEQEKIQEDYAENAEMLEDGEVTEEDVTRDVEGEQKYYNFFAEERIPLIHFQSYTTGRQFQSNTSKVEQSIPINQLYNQRKTQINHIANLMANPFWEIENNSGIDTRDLNDMVGQIFEPNQIGQVKMHSAPPIPPSLMEEANTIRRDFDNLMGAHDVSRGEVGANRTAREAMLLKEADEGGIALLIRSMKRGMEDIGKWWVHLMMLNYTDEHRGTIIGKEGNEEFITLTREDIEPGMDLYVEAGSIEPKDKNAERMETMDLMKSGYLDPIRGMDKLGYPSPTEVYVDVERHKRGDLIPLPPPENQEPQGPPQGQPGLPPGPPGGLPPGMGAPPMGPPPEGLPPGGDTVPVPPV